MKDRFTPRHIAGQDALCIFAATSSSVFRSLIFLFDLSFGSAVFFGLVVCFWSFLAFFLLSALWILGETFLFALGVLASLVSAGPVMGLVTASPVLALESSLPSLPFFGPWAFAFRPALGILRLLVFAFGPALGILGFWGASATSGFFLTASHCHPWAPQT